LSLHDPELLQEACVDVWNLALPLLQPQHRQHVARPFATCLKALETHDSPLFGLRVQVINPNNPNNP
jgi:hypothetical protein